MPISVIKFGGEVLNQPETLTTICRDVATLHENGHSLVIVHGGGAQVDELCRQLGITPKKINKNNYLNVIFRLGTFDRRQNRAAI